MIRTVAALIGISLALGPPALAQDRAGDLGTHLVESDRLLGDPGGVRSRLEQLGVDVQLFYNQFLSAKASGGGADSGSQLGTSGSYDFFTRADLQALVGWRGADALLHVKGQYDDNVNDEVGALGDPIDDADFESEIYVSELWLQQAVWGGRIRARLGFQEQQTVFDRNAFANAEDIQFLNAFLDNNAVVPLPNGLAAVLFVAPWPWVELATGIADADNRPRRAGFDTFFDGTNSLTAYVEARLRSPLESRGLPGAYRFGAFRDGRRLNHFGRSRRDRGHWGAYVSFDQLVWPREPGAREGLGLFARAGYADADVNRVEWFWSVGFAHEGPIPFRRRDTLGFGVYQTIASERYQDEVDSGFDEETGFELYYAIQLLGWLVITPDLQVILDPGATGDNDDVFVGSLRLRMTF